MSILFAFIGAVVTIIAWFILNVLSTILFGRSVTQIVFGDSGLPCLIVPMVGAILGFIGGNKVTDRREQVRINREIEQDRLKYENDKKPPL